MKTKKLLTAIALVISLAVHFVISVMAVTY